MSTLIVAFDGLDYEYIQKYCGNSLKQKEFGKIENSEGIKTVVTTELFASFITGETWESHGVIGLGKHKSDYLDKIEKLNKYRFFRKLTGFRQQVYSLLPLIDSDKTSVTRKDLKATTIFEEIENSKAIDIPAYSIGYNLDFMDTIKEHGIEAAMEDLERFTTWKTSELFDEMESNFDLLMVHFHKPDHVHHWFWEVGKMDKVEETYHEMEDLAAEIKQKAHKEGFDTVIFMSDHGLPDVENGGHNKNAFYSCNHELFGDETPHITDFHDKILDLTGHEDLERVDI
jgi:hypothetical protein